MIAPAAPQRVLLAGVALMLAVTVLSTAADAVMKAVAGRYEAPQVLFIAALAAVALTLAANAGRPRSRVLATGAPVAMALRALTTVLAAVGFFYAFRLLPFAEVFLYIGAMPLIAAALSGLVLDEPVGARVWAVLAVGFTGLLCLYPAQGGGPVSGHAFALLGSLSGTVSIVLSRRIGRTATHPLAQVFYPQALMALAMAAVLPWTARPVAWGDLGLIFGYAALVFAARWLTVVVLRQLPAWLALQLINLQFVWMVLVGGLVFEETTRPLVFVGATLIAAAGLVLALGEMRDGPRGAPATPAE